MNKINQRKRNVRAAAGKKAGKITKLPRLEMYAVLGLELGKRMSEKQEEIGKSVDFIAAEMKRQGEKK